MKTYELSKNKRAQIIREKRAAPHNIPSRNKKNFVVSVRCAADYPHRVVKLSDMQISLVQRKLYADMKPTNLFTGEFVVTEGFEEQFKEIAGEFGFNASEVMVCE